MCIAIAHLRLPLAVCPTGETGDARVDVTGDARFSVEEQDGLTNASQSTSNQGVVQALQQLTGDGSGGGLQAANTQVNVQATQEQQNANGTFVHVQEGHQGVVIINTNDESGALGEWPADDSLSRS